MPPPTPAPRRQESRIHPTPRLEDLVFWEYVDRTRRDSWATGSDAYGNPHPNTARFPNHLLSHIENGDDSGLWQRWWYCASRESQEDYGWRVTFPYGGSPKHPRITREYILRRGANETENALPLGTPDPGGVPGTGGSYITSTGGTYITSTGGSYITSSATIAVLVAQSEEPLPEPIGSLFVKCIRVFDVIPGSDDPTNSEAVDQADSGYVVSRPMEDASFLQLDWKINLPREVADNYRSSNYRQCPIAGYESLVLVSEVIEASEQDNQVSTIKRTYQGNSTGAAFPSTAYLRYQGRFYPSALPPERFIVSVRKVTDETRTDASNTQTVSIPDSPPDEPNNIYQGGMLSVQAEPIEGSAIRGKKSSEYYTDLVLTAIAGRQYDDNIGNYINYSIQALPATEAAALIADPGSELTVDPVNALWSVVTIETPVIGLVGQVFNENAKITVTTHPYYWPRVLTSLTWGSLPVRPEPGAEPVDSNELFFQMGFREPWDGDCRATVTLAYSVTNPLTTMASIPTTNFLPTPLDLVWPGVCNLHIPACLHPGFTGDGRFVGRTGTNHPQYGDIIYQYEWAATDPTDWPESIIIKYDVRPYKGGYAIRKVEVQKPNI